MPLGKVSMIFACGTALFSDGYANGIIGPVNTILRQLYPKEIADKNYGTTLSSLAFAGTIFGMLTFGYLSDRVGRKFGMMSATLIVALFSALSASSVGANGSIPGMLSALCAYRFLLGIGVGAEYPCGSVAASEQSEEDGVAKNAQNRWFTLATNSMIDLGFVISAFVPLVLLWIFGLNHLRAVWRVALGLGVVPALAVLIWRLKMEEPTMYKEAAMKSVKIPYKLILKRYWLPLVSVSTAWFLYNMIVYPFGLYSSTIVESIIGDKNSLYVVFGWNVVINLFYIPGTLTGAFIVDYLGPKNTMILGLVCQAITGFIMSSLYTKLKENIAAFAVLYGIFLSFGELGAGNNLGLLASKSGPTAIRGQFYGVAAAIGKCGAFTGTWIFPPIIDAFGGPKSIKGNTGPFWIGSGLALLSALITFIGIKPIGRDSMTKEEAEFKEYLRANGWDVSQMGLKQEAGPETGSSESISSGSVDEKKQAAPLV